MRFGGRKIKPPGFPRQDPCSCIKKIQVRFIGKKCCDPLCFPVTAPREDRSRARVLQADSAWPVL